MEVLRAIKVRGIDSAGAYGSGTATWLAAIAPLRIFAGDNG
jgi:hypothetical protein